MAANPEQPVAGTLTWSLVSVRLEELGIVGAGGGGFPAAVKFASRVSTADRQRRRVRAAAA